MAPTGLVESFVAAIQASLSVLLVISYGGVAAWLGLLNPSNTKAISKVCVRLFLPALLFTKIGAELHAGSAHRYVIVLVWALVCHAISFVLGIAGHLLLGLPDWTTAAIMFNNTTSYPLLLIGALDQTGILQQLVDASGTDDTTKQALERATSYFLVFSTVSSCLTFAVGPRLMDSEHAPEPDEESDVDDEDKDAAVASTGAEESSVDGDAGADAAEDEAEDEDVGEANADNGQGSAESSSCGVSRPASRSSGYDPLSDAPPVFYAPASENTRLLSPNKTTYYIKSGPASKFRASLVQFIDPFASSSAPHNAFFPSTRHIKLKRSDPDLSSPTAFAAEVKRRASVVPKSTWRKLGPKMQWWLLFLADFFNTPLLGALAGAVVGLTPALHRAFFNQATDGGIFTAWLTASLKNVGGLFVSLPVVVAGVSLYTAIRVPKKKQANDDDDDAGHAKKLPWGVMTYVLFTRFVLWPLASIAVIYLLASQTELLGSDPMLWFTLMLMPAGPSAMKLITLVQVSNADDDEETSIAKLLTPLGADPPISQLCLHLSSGPPLLLVFLDAIPAARAARSMVGVPGRSKGCNTCIQRKVKCDGGQPACGNCRKSNRLCTGYKRPVAFVLSPNVCLGHEIKDDAEGATITTQGRWRKRVRKPPQALAQARAHDQNSIAQHDPSPAVQTAGPVTAAAVAPVTPLSTVAPGGSSDGQSRAIDAVDLTTATLIDRKRMSKRFIYHDSEHHSDKDDDKENCMASLCSQPHFSDVGVGQDKSSLRASANMAMPDFASPLCLQTTTGLAKAHVSRVHSGTAFLSIGSPTMLHVSTEAAWREQLFPMFLRHHMPSEQISDCKAMPNTLRSRNWLLNLSDVSLDGAPALETAMTALCMARVGRHARNVALVQHSLSLYTKGLRQLRDAIHDPNMQLMDQTLAACMAFSMYEVAECPSRHISGYYSHHAGGLALLQMRGADAHMTPLGHSLFVFMRIQHFVYGLLSRKANFMSRADWTNKPWRTSTKDIKDKFIDQMLCVPVLMEQMDELEKTGPILGNEALVRGYWDLVGQYRAIYQCLQGWHKDMQAIMAGPLYWPELSSIPCPPFDETDRGRPFAVAFHFPAFGIGQSMVLWWLIAMVVNQQLRALYTRIIRITTDTDHMVVPLRSSGDTAARFASLPTPSGDSPASVSSSCSSASVTATTDASSPSTTCSSTYLPSVVILQAAADEALAVTRSTANNICQSVEYFLQDKTGDIGPLSMILPLTTLRHVLSRTEPLKPCPPGPPGLPGEYSDEVVWTDFWIRCIGDRGQRLAFHLD
ncbi:hypothetical protein SEPCBS119000_006190 [Sporothrix epigloea]|uniref:Zn(2)-C6 fungal-type domain-containing protein n=1 Tax=Sporothrix epigloea TaxID=1892477 RepID=A0ABP0E214_9PEZI